MTNKLPISLYDGAYGLMIRMYACDQEGLTSLHHLFRALAVGELQRIDFAQDSRFSLEGLRSLILESVKIQPRKALKIGPGPSGPTARWSNTPDEWLESADKTENLLHATDPGHQYLTTEGVDDALILLSYME